MSNTKRIGAIGELAVIQKLLEMNYEIFREISDNSKIDLIACKDGQVVSRIQVKTVSDTSEDVVSIANWKTTSGKKFGTQNVILMS